MDILDKVHMVTGPWCAQTLTDLVADAFKIERAGRCTTSWRHARWSSRCATAT